MNNVKTYLSTSGAILFALSPRVFCPSCWPAYASILSSMGLGFIDYTPYLLPLMFIFLFIALWGLHHKAATRKGYRPFILGCIATSGMILNKFVFELEYILYASVVLFVIASLWNAWPAKQSVCTSCN